MAMYAQWPLHLGDCQRDHAPAQWDSFKMPHKVLEAPAAAQPSPLLAMPTEVLLHVFAQADAVDQLFLALACKRLAAVASMAAITIPSAPKHRAGGLDCRAMMSVLRVLRPLDARGRPRTSCAACCDCYRYRPRRKSYWKGVWERYQREWPGTSLTGYDRAVDSWTRKQSSAYQCPECWCAARISQHVHV